MPPFRRGTNYDPLTPLSQRSFYRPNLTSGSSKGGPSTSRHTLLIVAAVVTVVLFGSMIWYGDRLKKAVTYIRGADVEEVEVRPLSPDMEELRRRVDQKYCGVDKCRFLVPVVIIEQESKSQSHFRHLAFLSRHLSRTIVLPNVGSAFLGLCRPHPFSYYYSLSSLEARQSAGHFQYITRESYDEWLSERGAIGDAQEAAPSAVDMHVLRNRSIPDEGLREENCWKRRYNYAKWGMTKRVVEVRDPPDEAWRRAHNLTEMLRDGIFAAVRDKREEEPDVINVWYDRRIPFINDPAAQIPLTYATYWTNLASTLTNPLSPLIAVHWRMEGIEPASKLVDCARNLTQHIRLLAQRNPAVVPTIYFLTDYPHLLNLTSALSDPDPEAEEEDEEEGDVDASALSTLIGAKPESETFSAASLTHWHHDAVAELYGKLELSMSYLSTPETDMFLERVRYLIPPSVRLLRVRTPEGTEPDHSVLGIMDKIVATRARWFLAGAGWKCARYSSFTQQIIRERKALWDRQGGRVVEGIANVVEFWE
ncbi:hypothetical protein BC936DRAFT_142767 [Jimgerdemannia flammicorona]|uniref:GDP-fucose protein O-fucosyltransferase-domain-containing protein n=1 Tax=Jimgerdemannia flammicorona TaxID=994334 RepID=A0A433DEU6_9FUNG|nr:hypothetical protein BC936DRAFT_142767 [Jimgerdemannia flammicorona]